MLVAANLRPAVVAVGPLVDDISRGERFGSAVSGLLTTLPVLCFGLVSPIAPRLAARFGIERAIFGSLVVLLAAIGLRAIPGTLGLFAGSALVGLSIGACNVVLPALIKRDFTHRSGLMTGLYSMTLSGGAAVAVGTIVPIDDAVGGHWRLSLATWALPVALALLVWLPQLSRVHTAEYAPAGSLWRNPIAWAITVFMGAQSLVFYTLTAWLPAYLADEGFTRSAAGSVLAIGQIAALIASLVAPIVAGRFADQRLLTTAVLTVSLIGLVGLLTTDHATVAATILLLLGPGSSISLALLFMVLRSNSTAQTGQVSGMAQTVGYLLAALGPVTAGTLHDATGSWEAAFTVVGAALIIQLIATTGAARNVTM
ncbi:MAG: MFS transporter [Gordonia sp. (in: high G+C Gram-positive bacteria)]